MAYYLKVNKKVAEQLKLERDRNSLKDGNFLLWQSDILPFGPLTQLGEILEQIGGIALLPSQAREEQDGTVQRVLPIAADERFVMEAKEDVSKEDIKEDENEQGISE